MKTKTTGAYELKSNTILKEESQSAICSHELDNRFLCQTILTKEVNKHGKISSGIPSYWGNTLIYLLSTQMI